MIRFMNLAVTESERDSLLQVILQVFNHGIFINGPELTEFESEISKLHNRKYANGVCSGSGALLYALKALGIGMGDEVITTSLSWIATANAIASSGATPIFADVDSDLNINIESIEKLITHKTKAILPVHYAGRVCKIDEVLKLAKENNLKVLEDASQAIGASKNGILAGSFGDVSAFSLNPMKVLGALGEAGVVLSDNKEIKERIDILRYNGTINKESCIAVSLNGRMDTLQASILLERLRTFTNIIEKRREIAYYYHKHLEDVVKIPLENEGEKNSWYSYTIMGEDRDYLQKYLLEHGIETKIQHPILMPEQIAYKGSKCIIDNAQKIVKQILCIPANEKITKNEQDYIIERIRRFYGK